jgi:choice-of-anchor B domain-containing protein
MDAYRSLLVVASLVATVASQGANCVLLGTYNNHGPFNDIWGYTAPNGDEYALLGTTTGTAVVDVTNPLTPVERGWFPWSASSHRDIRTYGHHAYIGTESGAGFQILDLQNPNSPTDLGAFGTANSNNSHNVCIDVGAGRLYLVGCNTGTPAYDLTANPANPTFLGYAAPAGITNYLHDLHVENGYGYASAIASGTLRIWDVSTFPPTTLSNTSTPNNLTHSAWPNAAGTICATADETTGGVVKFWDITNKSSPQPLGQFTPNTASIPHNVFIIGDHCHVSWYTEGYRLLDISNPQNPVEVASYDTWPGISGGFNGAWGCYPFLPSENVLISDRSTGLYILRPQLTGFASKTPFGTGCYDSERMVYEQIPGNTTPIDLINSQQTLLYTPTAAGGNYTINPIDPGYDGVTPAANGIDLATLPYTSSTTASWDDASIVLPLPTASFPSGFPFPGGRASAITVNSNGKIYLGSTIDGSFATNGSNYGTTDPFQGVTGAALPVISPFNTDLDPAAGGNLWYEDPGPNGGVRITWASVPNWPITSGGICDVQLELLPSGQVTFAYGQQLANAGSSNDAIVGFSAGNGEPLTPQVDWSALNGFITGDGSVGLAIDGDARPVLGTTVNLTVDNIPAGAPIAAVIYGLTKFNPGIDLTALGMAGCFQYCSHDSVSLALAPGSSMTEAFVIPNSVTLSGLTVIVQSGAYAPGIVPNLLGATSSNGIELTLDVN